MTDTHNNSIQQAVLDKVRAGLVRRQPRVYFVLRVIAVVVVALLLLAVSAVVISFILFTLYESGHQFLLGFGLTGVHVFLLLFPWVPALIAIGLALILQRLVQGFKFGYRIPLLNIFFGIVGISVLLGALINLTPLHPTLLGIADRHHLPVVGDVYEHIFDRHEDRGVCRGTVVSTSTDSFVLKHDDRDFDHDDGTFTAQIPAGSGLIIPHVGDRVLVFGQPAPGHIVAKNIQVLPGR
jgi:hypothetical protein